MRTERIAEVGMDDEGKVFVRPVSGSFEYIYRAGMEIYWNESTKRLSHPAQRDWSPARWVRQIVAAMASEYHVLLELTDETVWSNVSHDLCAEIIAEVNRKPAEHTPK